MTLSQRSHAQIAPVALIVAGLGAANWYFQPQRARAWIIAMGTMAVIWLVVVLFERVGSFPRKLNPSDCFLVLSVVTAGLMVGASLGIALIGGIGFEAGTLPKRVLGIMIGLVLVVIGNTVPKVLGPLAAKRCFPSKRNPCKDLPAGRLRSPDWLTRLCGPSRRFHKLKAFPPSQLPLL